ncbi:hypothetical protein LMG26858_06178 [Achromobacter anxifer]|uniref:Uncharacterized protein n=1 Tax=Achromobacter anxifer TaxID=1287737 RepID=A0A6S7EXG4_9BURK|nr:hypothetical protein [Achromobacter anxifer]CAB3928219.1 hypothetical protein LMG26858_06178 [Achromobacter anxifer]
MTDHTPAAQAAMQDPISEAISILTADATSIRESHTPPCDRDDWNSEPEAKAYYDRLLRVAGELSKLRAPVADGLIMQDKTLADRLDRMAFAQPTGSQAQSDLLAAATIWRKHVSRPASAPVAGEATDWPTPAQEAEAAKQWDAWAHEMNQCRDASLEQAARICDAEGQEWDSDAVITEKNYAEHCGRRIRALKGSAAPQASEAVRVQALAALQAARSFIHNGVELGFIRMPDPGVPDPAHRTPGLIDAAIAALSAQPGAQKKGGSDA